MQRQLRGLRHNLPNPDLDPVEYANPNSDPDDHVDAYNHRNPDDLRYPHKDLHSELDSDSHEFLQPNGYADPNPHGHAH